MNKDPLTYMNICLLHRSSHWEWRRPSFLLNPGSRHGSRQACAISHVQSLPLLQRSVFPHTHAFAIFFPRLTSYFLLRLLKSCLAQVTGSRITLKYFKYVTILGTETFNILSGYLQSLPIRSCVDSLLIDPSHYWWSVQNSLGIHPKKLHG